MNNEKKINVHDLSEEDFLKQYDANIYNRLSVSVDMLIFTVDNKCEKNYRKLPEKVLKVLMVKRQKHPNKGQWALPGGFVKVDESLDEAARRELIEETNVDVYMEQLYTWGETDRDPRTRVIGCSYMALVDSSSLEVRAGSDAQCVEWFNVEAKIIKSEKHVTETGYIESFWNSLKLINGSEKLSAVIKVTKTVNGKNLKIDREIIKNDGIAFEHAKIIEYGIDRLKNKIEYTDIAFNLMPYLFALTELQQVYEVILGKELLKANFRRKVSNFVRETNEIKKDAGHRPSKLYKFDNNWEHSFV